MISVPRPSDDPKICLREFIVFLELIPWAARRGDVMSQAFRN